MEITDSSLGLCKCVVSGCLISESQAYMNLTKNYKGWAIAQNSSFLTWCIQAWLNSYCHWGECAENPLIASPPLTFPQPQTVLLLFFKCSNVCVEGRGQLLESVSSFHHALWVPGLELRSGVKLEMLSHLTDVFNLYIFLNCPLWRKV